MKTEIKKAIVVLAIGAGALLLSGQAQAARCDVSTMDGYLACSPDQLRAIQNGQFKARNKSSFTASLNDQVKKEESRQRSIKRQKAADAERLARQKRMDKAEKNADKTVDEFIQLPDGTWVESKKYVEN